MSTMQTAEPIKFTHLSAYNRQPMWLQTLTEREGSRVGLVLDAPYQRGDVWGVVRRRNLIRSLLMGVPVPAIVINDRFGAKFADPGVPQAEHWSYAIVDGKQRVTTYLMWLADQFAVPASWYPADDVLATEGTDDGPYVRYSGLASRQQFGFLNSGMPTVEGKFRTLAEERMLFDLINYGGVAQGESDDDATGLA